MVVRLKRCETCRFFGEEEPAHCRRFPPRALDHGNVTFPLVRPEWWCGEWRRELKATKRPTEYEK